MNTIGNDVLNIYYDPSQPGNAYLQGQTFALGGGGLLEPAMARAAPEPSTFGVLLLIAAGAWLRRRR